MNDLFQTPFNLTLGDNVTANVIAKSNQGDSLPSNTEQKLFAFAPRQVMNLTNDIEQTSRQQIGLKWFEPSDTQGAEILDYTVFWKNETMKDFVILVENHTDTKITVQKLSDDSWVQSSMFYEFNVQARNV